MQLYFGPNHRYFFHDGHGNFRYRAPKTFLDLFRRIKIKQVHSVAFGVADSFFILYTQSDGKCNYHFQHDGHYEALKSWLFDEGLQHGSSLCVTLGLDDAFFASSDLGHRWRNVPEGFMDYYQKFTSPTLFLTQRVNQVDLGFKGTYLGIGLNNVWFWDLEDEYPTLSALNPCEKLADAQWVSINPFARDQHFIVFNDGTVHYSLPREWAGDIAHLFQDYVTMNLQQQQQSHQYQSWNNRPTAGGGGSQWYNQPSYGLPQQQQQQQQPPPQQSSSGNVNEALSLANNVLDMYNNTTNAGGQTGGSPVDVNQALGMMQNSVQTMNNIASYGGQGLDMMNQITNAGLVVGQLGGQLAGAAAAGCVVM